MEELASVFQGFARLALIVGGGVSVLAMCFAGFNFLTAQGDPGKMAQAKNGVIGVVIGLGIMGLSFIVPRVISEVVIEPVGGVAIQQETGTDCDSILQSQLVFQRGASNASRIMQVISQIQVQRSECVEEVWDPTVVINTTASPPAAFDNSDSANSERQGSGCFSGSIPDGHAPVAADAYQGLTVGDNVVPADLRLQNNLAQIPRYGSGRDSSNNIIVYWSKDSALRPADGAACWLYVERLGVWSQNY